MIRIIPAPATVALMLFLVQWVLFPDVAWSNGDEDFLEELSEGLGVAALWGLIGLNALYYYSMGLKWISRVKGWSLPEVIRKPVKWKVWFRKWHYRGNPLVILLAGLHGIWAEEENLLLWAGWGMMGVLALTGWTMKVQGADQPGGKVSRLIHMQHLVSVAMVVLLVIGHVLADD